MRFQRVAVLALTLALLAVLAAPAIGLTWFRTGTAECTPTQDVGTRVHAIEDHYHYKSGPNQEWVIPGGAYWHTSYVSPFGGPVQYWKVGNRPPYNHNYWGSYGYCG